MFCFLLDEETDLQLGAINSYLGNDMSSIDHSYHSEKVQYVLYLLIF